MLYFFYFIIKKVLLFFCTDYVKLLLQMAACVEWVRKPMYYSCQPITTSTTCSDHLNRSSATSPVFHLRWVCFLSSEAVLFLFFCLFLFVFFNGKHSGFTDLVKTVYWMNWASAAGQNGNVINLRKLPCFFAGLFSDFRIFFFFFIKKGVFLFFVCF